MENYFYIKQMSVFYGHRETHYNGEVRKQSIKIR